MNKFGNVVRKIAGAIMLLIVIFVIGLAIFNVDRKMLADGAMILIISCIIAILASLGYHLLFGGKK